RIQRLLGRDCRRWPDLTQLASQLNCSPQTLRRRLREQGSSVQAIKDQMRREQAIHLLGRPELSIQEIAEQLGFSEASEKPSVSPLDPPDPGRLPRACRKMRQFRACRH